MVSRLRVYVAGPITKGDVGVNIQRACEAGEELIAGGYAPLVPQLTCYMDGPVPNPGAGGFTHGEWLEVCFPWVAASDAVVRLSGESVGADMEVQLAESLGIPVYESVADLIASPPGRGDERFHALLRQIGQLHDQKQADYGAKGDPFANVRASRDFGISPWIGACLRANDKVRRIRSFIENGNLKNESVEDSLMDNAVYNLIALILFREERQAENGDI